MTSLCPSCAQDVAGALRHFNIVYRYPAPTSAGVDYLIHRCTEHHSGCNEVALRLRSVAHPNIHAVEQEMKHSTLRSFVNKRVPAQNAFALYLRQLSFCWASVSTLRWLYRRFNTGVTVTEILQYIPNADTPARLQCYLYLEAWRRSAGGHRIPSEPHRLRKHCAAKVVQRRWRIAISHPDYSVCQRRLQAEFDSLAK